MRIFAHDGTSYISLIFDFTGFDFIKTSKFGADALFVKAKMSKFRAVGHFLRQKM